MVFVQVIEEGINCIFAVRPDNDRIINISKPSLRTFSDQRYNIKADKQSVGSKVKFEKNSTHERRFSRVFPQQFI